MKKDYTLTRKRSRLLTFLLVAAIGLINLTAYGQVDIAWNGSTDTDATNPVNWTPNEAIFDNNLSVDSAYKFTNQPELSLTGENGIFNLFVVQTGMFTIVDAGTKLSINGSNSANVYMHGNLLIQNGFVFINRNLYLEKEESKVVIEGNGSMEVRSSLLMGDRNGEFGGKFEIKDDGLLYCRNAPGRFTSDSLISVMTITDNGIVQVGGDWVDGANALIARNQIISDADHDAYAYYDTDIARTIIDKRSKDELFLADLTTIQVLTDELIPDVQAFQNRGFLNLVSKEWKYADAADGALMSFDPVQTGDAMSGVAFSEPGNYWVALVGETGAGTIHSDTVQISVTSPMVTVVPANEQTIRVGWTGGMITATTAEVATSLEWKYSTTSGGPYESFVPAVTVAEYTPDFTDEGIYYVVCEALVDATIYNSPEVSVKMIARNAPGQSIAWTGAFSTDATDNRNYEPMMHPWYNSITVAKEFVETPPVLANAGNDTISSIELADSAKFIVNKPQTDTLTLTADPYQFGKIYLQSGVINNKNYGRLDGNNSGFILNNDAVLIAGGTGGFIMGKKDGPTGGVVTLNDNSRMIVAGTLFRWATDTLHSILTVADNAVLELAGDQTSDVATWIITKNQLQAPEGFVLQYLYDGTEDKTFVTAKSEVAFDIDPRAEQFIGIGQSMSELSTINAEVITSQEWKYATVSGGPYMSFDPAQTGTTLTASFAAAGPYYVVCEGSDGTDTYTSDEAIINVVSVEIAPASMQALLEFEEGDQLTVTESVVPDSREWKSSTTSGSGYASFSPARLSDSYRPFFSTEGTYYVVCESFYGTNGIISNEVEVVVTKETSVFNDQSLSLSVYPNPSEGTFFLNVENGNAFKVELFDISGRLVFEKSYINVSGPQEIKLSSEGLHMMKVTQDDKVRLEKIVVR